MFMMLSLGNIAICASNNTNTYDDADGQKSNDSAENTNVSNDNQSTTVEISHQDAQDLV